MINHKILLCLVGFSVVLGGCSLEAKKGPSLLLRFDPNDSREALAPQNWFRSGVGTRNAPAMSQFACIGVNVTGNGIGDTSIHEPNTSVQSQALYQSMLAGSSCSYRGVVGGMTQRRADGTYLPLDVSLQIPAGSSRLVQVFGVGDILPTGADPTTLCNSALQDDNTNSSGQKLVYELARARLPAVFSSQSITLNSNLGDTAAWSDTSNKLMDCEDETAPACVIVSSNPVTPNANQTFGSAAQVTSIAIPFTVTTPFIGSAATISVNLTGNGTNGVVDFTVYTDSSGKPGNTLTEPFSATLSASAMSVPTSVSIPAGYLIQAETYWFVIEPNSAGAIMPYANNIISGLMSYDPMSPPWNSFGGTPIYTIQLCP